MRGSGVTKAFLTYEARQASAMGMKYAEWQPKVLKEDIDSLVAV